MRRSSQVLAPLLAATALALVGCRKQEPQRCVDEKNQVVDPKFCANLPPNAGQPVAGSLGNGGGYYGGNGMFFPHYYRYYYGGGGGFMPGAFATGGGYAPIGGHSYAAPSASGTSRGGFGSSFNGSHSSSGGGHGSGGGE